MGKRRKPSWVVLEWDELVLDKGSRLSLAERERRWQSLFERTFVGGSWQVEVDEAGLVARLGHSLSLEAGNLADALARIRTLFEHPDMVSGQYRHQDKVSYFSNLTALAHCEIINGLVDEGLSRLRHVLLHHGPPRTARTLVRFGLPDTSFVERNSTVDPRVVEFVRELLLQSPGCKGAARSLRDGMTAGELEEILFATHGR